MPLPKLLLLFNVKKNNPINLVSLNYDDLAGKSEEEFFSISFFLFYFYVLFLIFFYLIIFLKIFIVV